MPQLCCCGILFFRPPIRSGVTGPRSEPRVTSLVMPESIGHPLMSLPAQPRHTGSTPSLPAPTGNP